MPFAAIWVDLEITILGEVSLIEKDKCHIVSHSLNLKNWEKLTYLQNRFLDLEKKLLALRREAIF